MEQDSKEKNKNFQKKINAKINNLQDVIEENTKRLKEEQFKVVDLNNLMMYVLPSHELSYNKSIYTKKTEIIIY